jgi:hypothetical protein
MTLGVNPITVRNNNNNNNNNNIHHPAQTTKQYFEIQQQSARPVALHQTLNSTTYSSCFRSVIYNA